VPNPDLLPQVDHIDGNKLNNNINNLRWVSASENQHNRKTAKGYYRNKQHNKWQAQININKKIHFLGFYDTAEEARQAYLDAKKIHHPTSPINK
jgi:hypothetical protein